MIRGVNGHGVDGTCQIVPPDELVTFKDVSAPVGALENLRSPERGNFPADVCKVQQLLNEVSTEEGGQMRADGSGTLVRDGKIGPITRAAIRAFQKRQFPTYPPDSVVQHSRRTIVQLNQLAVPKMGGELQSMGRAAFANAASIIGAGRVKLGAYRMSLDLPEPLFPNEKLKRLVNYHFHLDRSSNPQRDLAQIDRILMTMYSAAAHVPSKPDGQPGYGFVDSRPLSDHRARPFYAYTFLGGYSFARGKTRAEYHQMMKWEPPKWAGDQRVDMLYLTPRVLNAAPGILQYVIIHELAHLVGGLPGAVDCIADRAYYDRNRAVYEKLTCQDAMTNADSYSEFCWEARYGFPFVP